MLSSHPYGPGMLDALSLWSRVAGCCVTSSFCQVNELSKMSSPVVIDFQAFQDTAWSFIVKELAVVDVKTRASSHWIFAPPEWGLASSRSRILPSNKWLTKYFHGLHWDDGYTPYHKLKSILAAAVCKSDLILVKGYEKSLFIRSLLPDFDVINLEDIDCPKITTFQNCFKCIFHKENNFKCAKAHCTELALWYLKDQHL
ncbi:hypothetical protein O3M35_005275 [Rhynocoris fuscipes]|uniref:Uncharacterized protein n=1 Tax=Rhynocoris fuscipes TaxID=488301 RepID=A0AAW1DJ13_9HEMI